MEHGDFENGSSSRGGIITARGTGSGLIIRVDGRVKRDALKDALYDFLNSRKSFLSGNEVTIEWVATKPEAEYLDELANDVFSKFDVRVRSSKLRIAQRASLREGDSLPDPQTPANRMPSENDQATAAGKTPATATGTGKTPATNSKETKRKVSREEISREEKDTKGADKMLRGGSGGDKTMSLFDGIEAMGFNDDLPTGTAATTQVEKVQLAAGSHLWDDPDCRLVSVTLRSGQKIETEHSVVIFGDVNSGAEVIAGGDIVVLGTLRGVAHAGAYDESGGGKVIFSLNLQPTQLRIGGVISRGSDGGSRGPEIARIEGNLIIVEPYQSKIVWGMRRDNI